MFQSVRPNSPIYVLHKGDNPRLETGYVANQPIPKPKYQMPHTFGQPQEMIVDLVIKLNDMSINLNSIPANLDIADSYSNGESIVISDSREAMNSEIISLKQKSVDLLNSVDYHKSLIACYDKLLSDFNPEMAEKQAQQQEIAGLRNQIDELSKSMALLVKQLKNNKEDK
jgi:predicted RNase H-like nuclease (RuvC/YqgF family)